ncbi:hypothetical protein [Brucella intermedia]|uniref:hypothetical protein n=1 Tax=Brucella intermedia TaxID=94625 RepID=UPI001AED9D8E|nr:hypothetical protein [Brucella intermedia]
MASELEPCPFCSKTMMLRSALWPSEGDADAIIHADPTDCPMLGFSDGSADGSIIEKWNCSLSNEDDFPSDGSCVRCGSVPRNANGLCNTCLDEDAERLENTRPATAATDTGLVTVGYQYWHDQTQEWLPTGFPDRYRKDGFLVRELVTRSQAVELLAAKDEQISAIAGHLDCEADSDSILHTIREIEADKAIYKERAETAEADNAALTAKLETANALVTCCCGDPVDAHNMGSGHSPVDQYHYALMQLEAKLAAAEKALAFYADPSKWNDGYFKSEDDGAVLRAYPSSIENDQGDKVRAALGGKPS